MCDRNIPVIGRENSPVLVSALIYYDEFERYIRTKYTSQFKP